MPLTRRRTGSSCFSRCPAGPIATFLLATLPAILVMLVVGAILVIQSGGSYSYSLESDPDAKMKTIPGAILLFWWTLWLERKLGVCLALPIPFVSISYRWMFVLLLVADLGLCSNIRSRS